VCLVFYQPNARYDLGRVHFLLVHPPSTIHCIDIRFGFFTNRKLHITDGGRYRFGGLGNLADHLESDCRVYENSPGRFNVALCGELGIGWIDSFYRD
jgi:hypothetical protein